MLTHGGQFILSGQLECEKHFILDWFKEAGFSIEKELASGEWWAVRGS
jgi:ribosomal protein L11 methyltransferase